MSDDYDPDPERVQERATERQHERVDHIEAALEGTPDLMSEDKYPTTSEELATEYADEELDLVNDTESLGSVFDRLVDERFESPQEAREAIYDELTGEAGGRAEYNDQRALEELDDAESDPTADSGGPGY